MWHECGLDETIRTVDYDFIEIIRIWHDGRPTVVMMICSISLSNVASCSSAPASFGMTQLLDDSEIRSSHIPSFIFRRIYHCITQHAISRQIEKKNDEDDDVMLRDLYADYGIRTNGSALIVVGRLWFCFDMLRAKVLINFLFCRCFFVVFFAYVN